MLLLGRTGRRRLGGIGRSATMIRDALTEVGDVVRVRSVREPLIDIPSDTDVIYHYGDHELVEQQAAAAREAGIPILINSTYDDTTDRRRWMDQLLERVAYDQAYLVVFSESAKDDPRLHRIADRLVVVPKTIRTAADRRLPLFGERDGICIGELEKLRRARLVRGMDIGEAVAELRRRLPQATLYVYDQYGTPDSMPFEGVEVVKPGERMMEWLSERRLFVSFTRHETFSMPPAEAQAAGTPVLYRPMPQALSEHLGVTAHAFRTVEELGNAAAILYKHAPWWRAMSAAGRRNAHGRGLRFIGPQLSLALRKVVK